MLESNRTIRLRVPRRMRRAHLSSKERRQPMIQEESKIQRTQKQNAPTPCISSIRLMVQQEREAGHVQAWA